MHLSQIQEILDEEFTTSFEEKTSEIPLDRLLILLDQEKSLVMELLFMPTKEDVEGMKLLQMFVSLPFNINEAKASKSDIYQLLLFLNTKLLLGGFGFKADEDLLYYRYVLALPDIDSPPDSAIITETIWVAYYLVDEIGKAIEAVLNGSSTVSDLMA